MSRKTIQFGLGGKDIDRAIRDLQKFKQEFLKKVDTYRKRVAEERAVNASIRFGSSIVDGVLNGSPRRPEVTVSVSDNGAVSIIIAQGKDAVWCEFGAGVYHNGSVGSSPNPYANNLGFTIGSYGDGHGKQEVWGYYLNGDSKSGLVLTRGTPATMPMYNATQEVMRKAVNIAREVFG